MPCLAAWVSGERHVLLGTTRLDLRQVAAWDLLDHASGAGAHLEIHSLVDMNLRYWLEVGRPGGWKVELQRKHRWSPCSVLTRQSPDVAPQLIASALRWKAAIEMAVDAASDLEASVT